MHARSEADASCDLGEPASGARSEVDNVVTLHIEGGSISLAEDGETVGNHEGNKILVRKVGGLKAVVSAARFFIPIIWQAHATARREFKVLHTLCAGNKQIPLSIPIALEHALIAAGEFDF